MMCKRVQSQSNEPTMMKHSKTIVFFMVIFTFAYKGLLRLNLLLYVTKNTLNFFNETHFLY